MKKAASQSSEVRTENELPESIRNSGIFDKDDLQKLLSVPVPFIDAAFEDQTLKNIIQYYSVDPEEMEKELHLYAKRLLDAGKIPEAWQVLLTNE